MTSAQAEKNRARWLEYLAERRGGLHGGGDAYTFRCRRYDAVIGRLCALGMRIHGNLIYDVGAGMCDLGRRLHERGWYHRYVPVDAVIDGTDLEYWCPTISADFYVAIETIEHLEDPTRMLEQFSRWATWGAVITTPNPERVDVYALDASHKSEVWPHQLRELGWKVARLNLFGQGEDTILGWWEARHARSCTMG